MAKTTSVKSPAVKPTVTPTVTSPVTTNDLVTLTVVVVDAKGQPTSGARVSITPSNASDVTNSAGEVQFKLGTATKYDVTATYGSDTVTVPYYVTKNGATRLIVNPIYVKAIEQQLHPSPWYSSGVFMTVGIGLGIVVAFVIVWRLFRRK
jgi:hypothetical protein